MAEQTRTRFLKCLVLALFLFGFSGPSTAGLPGTIAEPTPLHAHVVWANPTRIYVALQDSLLLDPGTVLTFLDHKKILATGELLSVFEGTFLVARVTSGSLLKVKHLDRLGITAQALEIPSKLRLGYPASGRSNLLLACSNLDVDPSSLGYQAKRISTHDLELTQATTDANTPDTLIIRLFDDAADEEIALERGELDAGVFWPGEASAHIRDALHWRAQPAGIRDGEYLHASFTTRDSADDPLPGSVLEHLNQDLFRGDLLPTWTTPAKNPGPLRFVVDPRIPGHDVMQQFLDRSVNTSTPASATDWVRLDIAHSLQDDGAFLRFRCPILCRPGIARIIEALGPDRLVNVIRCTPEADPR